MNSSYLLDDCIYDILKYLRDDHSTLFNCLLVNRFWCKETVPLLYADPFNHVNDSINDKPHKCSIISTLILCFDKAEILQFKNQLIQFNDNNNYNYINDENEPLFKYPKYLENYSCSTVDNISFDKAEILQFKNQLIQFNDNINYNYINDENEPLFKYPKYLENYSCST